MLLQRANMCNTTHKYETKLQFRNRLLEILPGIRLICRTESPPSILLRLVC